jgi:DNA-binding beta-propeller fold protein YncE
MTSKLRLLNLVVAALACSCLSTAAAEFKILQTWKIGGAGGWDYLTYDAGSSRLFISRDDRVQVVDPEKGVVLTEIGDTPGVHGIALADDLGKGYTSNGRDNSVTVFDAKSLRLRAKIKLIDAENPDSIVYDAGTKRVITFNGRSGNASVIDAVSDKLVGTIKLPGKPESAVSDGKGTVWVDIEDKNLVAVIDLRRGVAAATWPLPGCDEPAGLAIDMVSRRLFVGCHNKKMLIIDADKGAVVQTLPIGDGVDANAFDPEKDLAFSSQGDGTLTIVREESADKFSVLQQVATRRGARTMALNPRNHHIYVVTADFEEGLAVPGQKRPRRFIKPDTFTILVVGEE